MLLIGKILILQGKNDYFYLIICIFQNFVLPLQAK